MSHQNSVSIRLICTFLAAFFCAVVFVAMPLSIAWAAPDASVLYKEADDYYKKLKDDKNLYKYRSNWETSIAKYNAVYQNFKSHNLASAALYRSGVLYLELFNLSKKSDDRTNGINRLKQVITEFPNTQTAKQAEDVLRKNGVTDIPVVNQKPNVLGPKKVKPENMQNVTMTGVTPPTFNQNAPLQEALTDFTPPDTVTVVGASGIMETAVVPTVSIATVKAEEYYKNGEKAYDRLIQNRELRLNRQNWNTCLNFFDNAYKADTKGPWAAASLYAKAMVYKDLYHYFGSSDYLQQCRTYLQRVMHEYPNSAYNVKARQFNAVGSSGWPSLTVGQVNPDIPVIEVIAAPVETTVVKTLPSRTDNADPSPQVYPTPVNLNAANPGVTVISADRTLQTTSISQIVGDKTTLTPGKEVTVTPAILPSGQVMVNEVRHWSNPQYTRVVIGLSGPTTYKYHLLVRDAEHNLPPRLYVDVEKSVLGGDVNKAIPINDDLLIAARAGQYTKDSVRVVVDLKSFGSYKIFPLNDPFRVVIDIWGDKNGAAKAEAAQTAQTTTAQTDQTNLAITQIKTGAPDKSNNTSEIILPVEQSGTGVTKDGYKLKLPKYIKPIQVAQATAPVQSGVDRQIVDNSPVTVIKPPADGSIGTADLAKQLGLGVKRIVIDPGHGGKDGGAPGATKGVLEKSVVLQLSLKLRDKVQQQLGLEVIMTRSTDVYLSLEERMAIANSRSADLFVSIHTNAARNKDAYGIETYFLNLATDEESIRVAAMENATSTRGISDLQNILNDLMQNSKINESSRLASLVQKNMISNLKPVYGNVIKDKGVKQAPFYVLLGATMPSILVETGFLSNPTECKRLTDPKYQDALCNSIVAGIKAYIKELQPSR